MMSSLGLWRSLRFALRSLSRNPGFATVVVLSLGLGIGANLAIFTIINGLLFKSLPIRQPEALMQITIISDQPSLHSFSYPGFEALKEADHGLAGVFAWNRTRFSITKNSSVHTVDGEYVSGAYFDSLGVRAFLGRMLEPADENTPGRDPAVAVISYGYWQREFGQHPSVIGQSIAIGEVPFTIVGVQPPEFHGLEVGRSADIAVPVTAERLISSKGSMLQNRGAHWLKVFGVLTPEAGPDNVKARLRGLAPQLFEQVAPMSLSGQERQRYLARQLAIAPAGHGISELKQQFIKPLWLLLGAVGFVLLIACANIANLLLARATARQGEMAVRLALGGGPGDIVRQLLMEGLLLTFAGAALGILLALWGSGVFLKLLAPDLGSIVLDVSIDSRILAFTGVVAVLVGTLFALAPALVMRHVNVSSVLKQNAGASGRLTGTRGNIRRALVVCQVAVSLFLLVGAGLFVQSLRNLQTLDLGFTRDNLLILGTAPRQRDVTPAAVTAYFVNLLERLNRTPGVKFATASRFGPLEGVGYTLRARVPGAPEPQGVDEVHVNAVAERFFDAVGIRLIRGRDISLRDTEGTAPVAVINASLARLYFPNQDPVGRLLVIGTTRVREPLQIIGVVEDVLYDGPRSDTPPTLYTAWRQDPAGAGALTVLVRTVGGTGAVSMAVRRQMEADAGPVRTTSVVNLRDRIDRTLGRERMLALLSGSFAWLALMLASVGLYGVTAYNAARRAGEIGLRMALGAQSRDVIWLVLRETLSLVLLGIALGVPAAIAITWSISSLLFDMGTQTYLLMGVGVAVMLLISGIAASFPARSAANLDPNLALRID